MATIHPFRLWLEFEHWEGEPGHDPYDDFFNMQVELQDGRTYAMNVWTFKFFERARGDGTDSDGTDSEGTLGGKYLLPPDLFVEKLDRRVMEDVIADLLATDQMRPEWLCPPEE